MRAVVHRRYGSPDVLRVEEVPKPTPGDDETLVKVHATTINGTDCGFHQAKPFIVRFFSGLTRPKRKDAPLAEKPANMSCGEAAAVCDGAIVALTYLRKAAVGPGRRHVATS